MLHSSYFFSHTLFKIPQIPIGPTNHQFLPRIMTVLWSIYLNHGYLCDHWIVTTFGACLLSTVNIQLKAMTPLSLNLSNNERQGPPGLSSRLVWLMMSPFLFRPSAAISNCWKFMNAIWSFFYCLFCNTISVSSPGLPLKCDHLEPTSLVAKIKGLCHQDWLACV